MASGHLPDTFYVRYGKRAIDIIVSSIMLIVTSPINLLMGIVTYFDVGAPILFRQKRIGKDEKTFTITKFRNMRNLYDENGTLLPAEMRITKFGRFVRKISLDELLNFWCVLKGDMSIIGPRPLLVDYLPFYSERQRVRHETQPGLECPSLTKRDHARTWTEQLDDDVWYVEHLSFLTDCRMIFALIKLVFDKKEIKRRSDATRGRFDDACKMAQTPSNERAKSRILDT